MCKLSTSLRQRIEHNSNIYSVPNTVCYRITVSRTVSLRSNPVAPMFLRCFDWCSYESPVPSIQIHLCIPYSRSEHLLSVITLEAFAFFTRPVSTVSVWSPSACILPRALLSVTVLQRVFFVWACSSVRDPRHMRVARRPYDKWLPGWLKRTLSLHNEHRRSISHCLWGKPGTSVAKLSVIPRNSTNVD